MIYEEKFFFAAIVIIVFTAGCLMAQGHRGFNFFGGSREREGVDYSAYNLPPDGVYAGTANGYRPDLTVEVTVANDRIAYVVSHNEMGLRYYQPPIREIPPQVVAEQSTDIDAVSGATATSHGILEAVEQALGSGGA